ncbi:ankyrin repeat domain-containing protein [Lysobacter silvisoli]|uniref:Phospholipase n=1 Tax=Lysobacter silvisoli TaxID=2293254 RepID=A0A371K727_9GAMM|nr:ankyrin repeat domain-containing protein [Lysobacter silvisoli]RDZ29761.1 phospholipase [Lysobacter silvisoli]
MLATETRPHAQQIFADPAVAALAEAVAQGDDSRVRALAAGTDLSARGDKNVTLLQWALLNQRLDSLKALLDAGADPKQPGVDGDTVVHLAAMANDASYLTELLARGVDPNVRNPESGAGPLRSALMGEREAQFHALLAAGADPNLADRVGNTPLHTAGQINEPARALDLLKAGADPKARNAQGATFQRYLFMTRASLLNAQTRQRREEVEAWLTSHGVALEGPR